LHNNVSTTNGTLSGATLNLETAFHNLMQHVQLPVEEALRMCNFYAASILKMDTIIGSLQPGARAEMLVLNNRHQIIDCIGF
jgi:N-acetylglucosamine-6-phosphate deacetylase